MSYSTIPMAKRSEIMATQASSEWDEHEYDEAIGPFKYAWKHAERAIEWATR